ncbi:MAG: DUF3108 domain-containing protein [Solitalea-like symbiont of Acarus siro]
MKKLIVILIVINLLYVKTHIYADQPEVSNNSNNYLIDGQELTFKIRYGLICCVMGKLLTSSTDHTFAGKPAMRIEFQAFTTNLVNVFTKINNYYQSYVDKTTLTPYYFSESVQENSFHRSRYTIFDRINNEAITDNATYKINDDTFDFLSLFFFVKSLDFNSYNPNSIVKDLQYVYYNEHDPSDIQILYLGKETIDSEFHGKIECFKISPIMSKETTFTDKAKTLVWISNDSKRLPIKIQTAISWGVVNVDLVDAKNVNQ